MNYLTEIKPLENVDQTNDAEIAAIQATRTVVDLPVLDVRALLRERKLWLKDPISRSRDRGPIGVAMAGGSMPSALYHALVELEAALYDQSAALLRTSTELTIAGEVAATLGGLLATGVIVQADIDAFYAIGGGLKYPGATAADVASDRQAYQNAQTELARQQSIEAVRANIENTWLNPAIADGASTAAEVIAAIKAGL